MEYCKVTLEKRVKNKFMKEYLDVIQNIDDYIEYALGESEKITNVKYVENETEDEKISKDKFAHGGVKNLEHLITRITKLLEQSYEAEEQVGGELKAQDQIEVVGKDNIKT